MIPLPYKLLGGGIAALVLVGGVFYMGNSYGSTKKQGEWDKAEISELNSELAEQKRINDSLMTFREETDVLKEDISERVINNTRTITEVQYRNNDVIKEVFRDTPFLSNGWVYSHDQLSKGLPIDPLFASDRSASSFTEEDSLKTIGENYTNARATIEQKEGWDDFYAGVVAANERLQDNAQRGVPEDSSNSSSNSTSGSNR